MVDREAVYQLVKARGPSVPSDLSVDLKANTILVGAFLSELHAHNKIGITAVKRGGSPFYYAIEQKDMLQGLRDFLNEKDRRTFDLLKEQKILEDTVVEPLTRVSLKNIKDFAVPVTVSIHGEEKLFWKWYLLSNEEVSSILQLRYASSIASPIATQQQTHTFISSSQISQPSQSSLSSSLSSSVSSSITPLPSSLVQPQKTKSLAKPLSHTEQKTITEEIKQSPITPSDDLFLKDVLKFFKENTIEVINTVILKKKSDIEFIIKIPTIVGSVEYYCRARAKKKANENDLALVYVAGEAKKLPVLFLTTGEVTKKAMEQIPVLFKNLQVKKI